MSKIVATEKGRIFMSGNDGHLHEFSYSFAPPSRFSILDACRPRKKIQKLTHSHYQICGIIPIGKSIPRFCRTYDHLTDPILGTPARVLGGVCAERDVIGLIACVLFVRCHLLLILRSDMVYDASRHRLWTRTATEFTAYDVTDDSSCWVKFSFKVQTRVLVLFQVCVTRTHARAPKSVQLRVSSFVSSIPCTGGSTHARRFVERTVM
jgi:hypothetical protein